jgi:hypothetical protein
MHLSHGDKRKIKNITEGVAYHWFNPKTSAFANNGQTHADGSFKAPDAEP